jgi:hypothetical protein
MILVQSCGSSVTASGAEEGSSSSPSPGSERERGASACMRRHQASALAPVLRLGPRLPHAAAPQGPRDRTPGDNITRSRPSIELLQPTRTGVGARARALPVATYRFPVIILKVCMLYIYSQTVELQYRRRLKVQVVLMIRNRVMDLCVKLSRCTCVVAPCRAGVVGS